MLNRRNVIGGAVAGVAAGLSPIAQAKTINLTIAAGHPPVIPWVRVLRDHFVPAVDKGTEAAGHKIIWNQAYGGTVAKIGGELDAIEKSVVDIAIVGSIFHPAKLNLLNVANYTPFSSLSVEASVSTIDGMYSQIPEMNKLWERHNATYLCGIGVESFNLYTKTLVRTPSDLKGMKIGGAGPNLNWLRGTGATGVVVSPPTIYNDLGAGIYDGILLATSQATSLKIQEVAPFMLKADFQATYWAGLVMNRASMQALPKELQTVIKNAGTSYRNALINEQNRLAIDGLNAMKQGGLKVFELARTERLAWAASLPDIASEWVKAVEERNQPGKKVLQLFMEGLRAKGQVPARNWDRA
jgi:TRAP-type C4-dicarboxylate transport system substrate-binding protein